MYLFSSLTITSSILLCVGISLMNVLGIEWTTLQWIMLLRAAVTQRNFAEESRKVDWIYSFMKKQSQRRALCVAQLLRG